MIFTYDYNNGGLADLIKFFMVSVYIADYYKLDFYIDIKHPIKKFLIINDKFKCNFDYSEYEYLSEHNNLNYMIMNNKKFIYNTLSYFNNSFDNKKIPNSSYLFDKYNFYDYINFSPEIYNYVYDLMDINKFNYISIHIRYGDKYVQDSKDFFDDDRIDKTKNYDDIIQKIIRNNKMNKIYFFCDNNEIKNNYCLKYSEEIIENTYKDTITEFLFIHLSNEIHSLTYSGFSLIAYLLRKKQNKFIKYHKIK